VIYLTTGFDMSYNPALRMGHHMFDNVFVNPEAYRSFRVLPKGEHTGAHRPLTPRMAPRREPK
jgi:hypothetical protein